MAELSSAVNGRQIYGDIPPAEFNHSQDAGNGRLIPTLAVEQMLEPLTRWFGLDDNDIATALPRLQRFSSRVDFI